MYMYLVSKETAMHSCIPLEGNRVGPIRRIKADSLIHTIKYHTFTKKILKDKSEADA